MYNVCKDIVHSYKSQIFDAIDFFWDNPELGYKEWKTTEYLVSVFEKLGYKVERPDNITGFVAELDTGRIGPKIAVMGELDALRCATHPDADKDTAAVHACGHHIQLAHLIALAAALKEEDINKHLCGSVRFIAVPAEETIDLEYRLDLINKGIISYMAGKIEYIKRGFFDGVDMAMMFHADAGDEYLFRFVDGQNGCITKHFEYEGKAAHAGGSPHMGINALYAASVGLDACNSLRETFREKDYVRYHPIINQGGVAANAIPDLVSMDTYVRASTYECMLETNRKINRAIAGSAVCLGANVRVADKPGNFPFLSNKDLTNHMVDIIEKLFGKGKIDFYGWDTQSSDVGDLSSLMPVVQHYCKGVKGVQHGNDYFIDDKVKCALNPAVVMCCLIYDLLKENGKLAKAVVANYKPVFKTKDDYFEAISRIECDRELISYEDNKVIINY